MEPKRAFSWTRLFVGLALLIPLLTTCLLGKVLPASLTVFRSFQKYNMIGQASSVGIENYERLLDDQILPQSITNTFAFVAARLFVVAVLPVVLAYLLSRLGRVGRTFYRICLTLIVLLFVPVALLQGWRILTHPMWGLLKETALLANPDTALLSLLVADGAMAWAVAGTLGTMAYMLAFRGTDGDLRRAVKPLLAIWLTLNLIVAFGTLLVFAPSFVLTGGGPMNKTMTLALYVFNILFQTLRVGYASAIYVPLLLLYAPLILVIWGISEWSGVHLAYVPDSEGVSRYGWLIGLIVIPIVFLVAIPILVPHLYSLKTVIAPPLPGTGGAEAPALRFGRAIIRSLTPIIPLLFLALPCAYLAALSISLIQPLGRIGSKILFLLFLGGSAIPAPLLLPALTDLAHKLGLLNTVISLALPYVVSGAAFYLLKLFFDSRQKALNEATLDGTSLAGALWQHAIVPSLPVLLLVLVIVSFAAVASGNLEWTIAAVANRDRMPAQLLIIQQAAQMPLSFVQSARYATQWTVTILILWAIPALPLQVWLVDRLALVSKAKEQ